MNRPAACISATARWVAHYSRTITSAPVRRALCVGLLVFASVSPSSHAETIAGPLTNPSNGNRYYLLSQMNWSDSEAEAISLGGHLVTIDNATENAWIVSNFANLDGVSRALWIGLTDVTTEGTFVWSSGDPVGYTNWGPNEPNNFGEEHWAHIFPSTDERFSLWNDVPNEASSYQFSYFGVVEVKSVPEPTGLALMAGAALWIRRKQLESHGRVVTTLAYTSTCTNHASDMPPQKLIQIL